MELKDKLQLLRKQNGYSQEQLADKLGIARQTLSKWENGQAVPELSNLISLSNLYGITIDRIVKDDDECNISLWYLFSTFTETMQKMHENYVLYTYIDISTGAYV